MTSALMLDPPRVSARSLVRMDLGGAVWDAESYQCSSAGQRSERSANGLIRG
jgi:hypothetical protein